MSANTKDALLPLRLGMMRKIFIVTSTKINNYLIITLKSVISQGIEK